MAEQLIGVEECRTILGRPVEIVVRQSGDKDLYSFLRYTDSKVTVSDSQKSFPSKNLADAEDVLRMTCYDVYYEDAVWY